MASLNVYLPPDLKKRMDAAGDLGWSRIAQTAFAEAIASQRIREDQDMTAVVERLRVSKKAREKAVEEKFFEYGADWARETAEYHQLLAVVEAKDHLEIMVGYFGGQAEYDEIDESYAQEELTEFFGFDFSAPNIAALTSFQEGAASIWKEVADEVDKE